MSKKKRVNYNATEVASRLHTKGTSDLEKKVEEELEKSSGFTLTAQELIKLSTVQPLVSMAPIDPQFREDEARRKESKLIDKVDGKFGAKYEDT